MRVFVHYQLRMFTLVVEASDTIGKVKRQIQYEQGIPHDRQRLFYFGYSTKDESVLETYNIQEDSSLHLEDSSVCCRTRRCPACLRDRSRSAGAAAMAERPDWRGLPETYNIQEDSSLHLEDSSVCPRDVCPTEERDFGPAAKERRARERRRAAERRRSEERRATERERRRLRRERAPQGGVDGSGEAEAP